MSRAILLTSTLTLLWAAPALSADQNPSWVEVSGSVYDPDWELRTREYGLRLAAQLGLGNWYLAGAYNTIATSRVDEPVVRVRGLPFRNWREAELGYRHTLAPTTSASVAVAYAGLELFDEIRSGYWIGATLVQRFGARTAGSLRLAYMELDERDWRLTGELVIDATTRLALVLRLDDFAEYDFTWYEVGARWRFR